MLCKERRWSGFHRLVPWDGDSRPLEGEFSACEEQKRVGEGEEMVSYGKVRVASLFLKGSQEWLLCWLHYIRGRVPDGELLRLNGADVRDLNSVKPPL